MKRIATCLISLLTAAGVLLAPQVVAPQAAHAASMSQGCPNGLTIDVDLCQPLGVDGISDNLSSAMFYGIDVKANTAKLSGNRLNVNASVGNTSYIDSCAPGLPDCGGLSGNGTFPCPAPPFSADDTCIASPITTGNWTIGIYDKSWNPASFYPGSNPPSFEAPRQDGLTAKCSDTTKCSLWDNVITHLCLGSSKKEQKQRAADIIQEAVNDEAKNNTTAVRLLAEEHSWLKFVIAIPKETSPTTRNVKIPSQCLENCTEAQAALEEREADTAANHLVDAGELVANCAESTLFIEPGDSRSGPLGFDTHGVIKNGTNVAIIWRYGGVSEAWTCQIHGNACKPVNTGGQQTPTTTSLSASPNPLTGTATQGGNPSGSGTATYLGGTVTYTATISPPPGGGTVQFVQDGRPVDKPVPVDSTGNAILKTGDYLGANQTTGSATFHMVGNYSGDSNYRDSSGSVTETVNAPSAPSAPSFGAFAGTWERHDTTGLTIDSKGNGQVGLPDFTACPDCAFANAPINTIGFQLQSTQGGNAFGTVTAVTDPNGAINDGGTRAPVGSSVEIVPMPGSPGQLLDLQINGSDVTSFCDSTAGTVGNQCGA